MKMDRKAAVYLIVAGLSALAGYGLHRANGSGPRKVEAQRLVLADPSVTPTHRSGNIQGVRKNPDPAELLELPEADRSLITGRGALDSASYFNGWITNGSSWTVTELRLWIAAGQAEGSTRWERYYTERVRLAPGAHVRISFKVTDGRNAETLWKIMGARGVPPR